MGRVNIDQGKCSVSPLSCGCRGNRFRDLSCPNALPSALLRLPGAAPRFLPSRLQDRGGSWKTSALCHEVSCSSCRRRSSAVPFLHIVPPSRSVPLHAVRAAAGPGPQAAGPFLRAYRACAPAPSRARLAPAPFAHLIARARRRTHFARRLPPGLFCGPQPLLPSAESEKAAPESRLSTPIIHHFLSSQAPWGEKDENFSNFLLNPERRKRIITRLSVCSPPQLFERELDRSRRPRAQNPTNPTPSHASFRRGRRYEDAVFS